MNRFFGLSTGLATAALFAACAPLPAPPVDAERPAHRIHIVSSGWHTGIVMARADVEAADRVPERAAFPGAGFLEFGWGDRDYYPASHPTLGLALGAVVASKASVMHLAGYSQAPNERYPMAEVVDVALDTEEMQRLISAVDATFQRGDGRRAEIVAPGLYRDSHFYAAHGRFSLANTCNTWTARMLESAGRPISSSGVVTASDLMRRVRALPDAITAPAP